MKQFEQDYLLGQESLDNIIKNVLDTFNLFGCNSPPQAAGNYTQRD